MIGKKKDMGIVVSIFCLFLTASIEFCDGQSLKLGAYYFDGWTGKSEFHLTKNLVDSFPDRKPVWGWKTSTPEIMSKQIDVAAQYGISFFSFCWYFRRDKASSRVDMDVKNNALNLFIKSPNKDKLSFNILVANHKGYIFQEEDWDDLCRYWCELFKQTNYLKVNNKPLITFFSIPFLFQTFKTKDNVIEALNKLRTVAQQEGLEGVTIAANVTSAQAIKTADACGFDILTGYNSHNYESEEASGRVMSIDSMRSKETGVWERIARASNTPIIPNITLNWDPRSVPKADVSKSLRYSGYSGASVTQSIIACRRWMAKNQKHLAPENVAILYAWNEYGEGSWLTPSATLKYSLLQGVAAGLK